MNYQFLTTSAYDDNWIRLYLTNVGFQKYELHYTTVGLESCRIIGVFGLQRWRIRKCIGLQSCHIRRVV